MNKILSVITGILAIVMFIMLYGKLTSFPIEWLTVVAYGNSVILFIILSIMNYDNYKNEETDKEKRNFLTDSNRYKIIFKEVKYVDKTEDIPITGTGVGSNGNVTFNTSFATIKNGVQAKFLIVFENDNSYYVGLNTYNSAIIGEMLPKEFRTSYALEL